MPTFEEVYENNLDLFDTFIKQVREDADDNEALAGALELFMDRLCETIDAVNEEDDRPF